MDSFKLKRFVTLLNDAFYVFPHHFNWVVEVKIWWRADDLEPQFGCLFADAVDRYWWFMQTDDFIQLRLLLLSCRR